MKRKATEEKIDNFKKSLSDCPVGFTWLLRKDVFVEITKIIPAIEDILFCTEYVESIDKNTYFIENSKLTEEQIMKMKRATVGQSANENWLIARKHRLTASKFGAVLNSIKNNKFPPNLFKILLNFEKVLAVKWGRENDILYFPYLYTDRKVKTRF
ncbi:unnamed protein product [Psylliodes chrysocephalus]|uniref:Uncharacterized protein n=1 Tax=Psylliodes chrysocephalus TaxID=3402493 RepID=A0A9P0CWP8_9CUCU|nr:unnamed protein product [Psylliodes chrysocephala]